MYTLLSLLDIDSLNIQEDGSLTLLSILESSSISNIQCTASMYAALIVKEQAKEKSTN
jgi:hypothetical protein